MTYDLPITGRTINDAMLIAHRHGAKLINVAFPPKAPPLATIEGTLKAVAATAREMTA